MLREATRIGVLSALATLMFMGLAAGQSQQAPVAPAGGNQAGPPADGGFPFGNFDPNMIRHMMDDNSRQTLGATPEEWKVLGPRFNKVQALSRSLNGGATGMFGMFGRGRGDMGRERMGMPGAPGGMGDAMRRGLAAIMGGLTELDKARDSLYAAVDENLPSAELQAAIKAFRGAKEKIRQDLAAAQADLRTICTVRQEATLMAMGLLD